MESRETINPCTIRQATLGDINGICAVENSAFPSHRQASREILMNRIKLFPEGCYVAICDGEIAGFSTALIINDLKSLETLDPPDEQLHNLQGNTYYLRSVGIKPECQGKGLGKALVTQQVEHAQILNKDYFRFTSSEDVEEFYTKLGFARITDYCDFHGSVQAVWEMSLRS